MVGSWSSRWMSSIILNHIVVWLSHKTRIFGLYSRIRDYLGGEKSFKDTLLYRLKEGRLFRDFAVHDLHNLQEINNLREVDITRIRIFWEGHSIDHEHHRISLLELQAQEELAGLGISLSLLNTKFWFNITSNWPVYRDDILLLLKVCQLRYQCRSLFLKSRC